MREGDGGVSDKLDRDGGQQQLRVSPRKTGTVPGGSMITNSVTKTSQKNFMTEE